MDSHTTSVSNFSSPEQFNHLRHGQNFVSMISHGDSNDKLFVIGQDKKMSVPTKNLSCIPNNMTDDAKHPFKEIGDRIAWLRKEVLQLDQHAFAESIQMKRARFAHWEIGSSRLSLDGAMAIRDKHGLSLDFLYYGDDGSLPMNLRNSWRDRSLV